MQHGHVRGDDGVFRLELGKLLLQQREKPEKLKDALTQLETEETVGVGRSLQCAQERDFASRRRG